MARSRSPAEAGGGADAASRDRRIGRRLLVAVAALALAAAGGDAGRDRFDAWIDATALPSLAVPTGTEVLARDGSLLRAFQVGDGIWRLAPPTGGVDAGFQAMLLQWEDRRFRSHRGVDPRAVLRAAAQSARHGRVVSGASTLTMQVARLLERGPTATGTASCGRRAWRWRWSGGWARTRSSTSTCASRPMAATSRGSAPPA